MKEDRLKQLMNFKIWFGKYRDKTFSQVYFIQKDWLEWFSRCYKTPFPKARKAVVEFLQIMDKTKPQVLKLMMEIDKIENESEVKKQAPLLEIYQEYQIEVIA